MDHRHRAPGRRRLAGRQPPHDEGAAGSGGKRRAGVLIFGVRHPRRRRRRGRRHWFASIAPGFIDVHVHSELARLGGVDQFAGILDGVTTELMSPDGFSWAPLEPDRLREVKEYLQVFYGDPDIGWDWSTV